jgi:hypothetical protein
MNKERVAFYYKVLRLGNHFVSTKDGRYRVEFEGMYFTRSTLVHFVWNPNEEPLRPGEQLHHRDLNRLRDTRNNLVRMSSEAHLALHKEYERRACSPRHFGKTAKPPCF